MKRKATIVLAAVLAAALASAWICRAEAPDGGMERVTAANSLENLQEKYGVIAVRSHSYFEDGTVQSRYIYKDAKRYIAELEGSVTVDKDGEVYGFDEAYMTPYRALFADGAYEEYKAAETLTDWEHMCALEKSGQAVFEAGGSEQVFRVEAETDHEENGFAVKSGEYIDSIFFVDDATGEITGFKRTLIGADGSETVLQEGEVLHNAEAMEPDLDMRNRIFSGDVRTAVLIVDPGTAQEKTYTQTVGKGCMFRFFPGGDDGGAVYADMACTQPYEDGEGDRTGDITVYAKRAG